VRNGGASVLVIDNASTDQVVVIQKHYSIKPRPLFIDRKIEIG